MPQFYMAYHVTRDIEDPTAQAGHQARYQAWMQEHADALVVAAQPLGPQWTVSKGGATEGFDGTMMGYTILDAPDLEAATAIAASCPFCEMGNLQLAEMMVMQG